MLQERCQLGRRDGAMIGLPFRIGREVPQLRQWERAVTGNIHRREVLRLGAGLGALTLLAACQTMGLDFGDFGGGGRPPPGPAPGAGERLGDGPVKVALLLPLSGDARYAAVGTSMANAARLAMDYVAGSPQIGDNITLLLMDTGPTAAGAAQQASAAVSEGVALILGPLTGDQVAAAGAVAKSAGVPLIGFSNDVTAAAPGVYLLNVLPQSEVQRSLGYALAHGRKAIAAIFPTTDFGRAQQAAFQTTIAGLGLTARASFSFANATDQRNIVAGLAPQINAGNVDALFLPDRASAPAFAKLLRQAGVPQGKVLVIGSADWDRDTTIVATPYLAGAVYPAVDDIGYRALEPEYVERFGSEPHPLATIAYTAAILANAGPLARAKPPYGRDQLTAPGGFNGRDGVFRFLPDGRSEYALIMKQVAPGGAVRVDGPKL
jgi:ABC-type branched-subunit amino acid transport system substrate-binding protein